MSETSGILPRWFNGTVDWKMLGAAVLFVASTGYFGMNSWQESKMELRETRNAINSLAAKFDDAMSKRDDRLTVVERELRNQIQNLSDRGARERQILESRVIKLESSQESDDKRAREDAVALATMREQMNTLVVTVNSLRDLMINAIPSTSNQVNILPQVPSSRRSK